MVICFCTRLANATISSVSANASFALFPNRATTDAISPKAPLASCAATYTFRTRSGVSLVVPLILLKELIIISRRAVVCVRSSDSAVAFAIPCIVRYVAATRSSFCRSPLAAGPPSLSFWLYSSCFRVFSSVCWPTCVVFFSNSEIPPVFMILSQADSTRVKALAVAFAAFAILRSGPVAWSVSLMLLDIPALTYPFPLPRPILCSSSLTSRFFFSI